MKPPSTLRKSPPKHDEIAAAWPEFADIDPCCFACGYNRHWWFGRESGDTGSWSQAGLERAHIVGRSIGGSFEPSNFLLLCPRCHRLAPMSNDRRILLDWVRSQPSMLSRIFKEIGDCIAEIGEPLGLMEGFPERFGAYMESIEADMHPHSLGSEITVYALLPFLKDFVRQSRVFAGE